MVNKNKILSDLSKMALDAMSTFSGVKKEIETIVSLRVNKVLNKMNLVKRDEFEVLKEIVQKLEAKKTLFLEILYLKPKIQLIIFVEK